jgi:effector-binding domain-containing protein
MQLIIRMFLTTALVIAGGIEAMAVEEVRYEVIEKEGKFEIRDYAPHIIAETLVDGSLEDAGNKAFKALFGYISGDNRSRAKVAMTAPVNQKPAGENIKMTGPVGQQRVQDKWAVSFSMPAAYTLETLPVPENPEVNLRSVPARRMAAVRYSGFWSERSYLRYKSELESWVRSKNLSITGAPIWARYNPPYMPWFLRRNEILIPINSN